MELSIGDFKYAGSYGRGFDVVRPIAMGDNFSSEYTDALSGDSVSNFKTGLDFANAGLNALGQRVEAKERAKAYLEQAKITREANAAAARKRTGSGIGSLLGTIAGGLIGGPVGAGIGGALGGAAGGLA